MNAKLPLNFNRTYRRVNAKFGSDDEENWGAVSGGPLDDDMVFVDSDRHDDVFQEVLFSPSKPRRMAFNSSTTSFHDDYLIKDVPGPSGR